jgi:prophage regulatory protein
VLRRAEVTARTGLGRSTLYAQIQAGSFPQSVKLGPRAVGWIEAEVAEWITERIAARDAAEAAAVKPNHA